MLNAAIPSLREVLASHVAGGSTPGLVALLSRGDAVRVETLGTLSVGGSEPMRRDTIFRISSMTKPVVAAAALILLDEGRLQLDSPVEDLLPELANRRVLRRLESPLEDTVPAARPLTLRDLLTFRMGFGIVMAPPGTHPIQRALDTLGLPQGPPQPTRTPAPDEWMRRFGTLPLLQQPGEGWLYHTASEILGVLIACAANQSLGAFLQERLFGPLGMEDTGFHVPASKQARFAPLYLPNGSGDLNPYPLPVGGTWDEEPVFPSGGGGLVSTADDFLAFAHMLLRQGLHGDTRILSEASVRAMTTNQLTPAQQADAGIILGAKRGWGFGLATSLNPPGPYGWDGGLGSSWANDPTHEQIGILLTPVAWTSPRQPDVCRAFWSAVSKTIDF